MLGPIAYDLASLLRDCYIEWPAERVEHWLQGHRERLVRVGALDSRADAATFRRWFDHTGLQRHIKVLGIFCRLCYRDGKLCYPGNDLEEFQRAAYERMRERGINPVMARLYTFMIRFAPRWRRATP